MSTPSKPAPYAPDMFSEHARLAQLGARVLEILANRDPEQPQRWAEHAIEDAARSLGLLPEVKP